jgi:hypothetical protein
MMRSEDDKDERRQGEPVENPAGTGASPADSQVRRSLGERSRTVEPIDPQEPRQTPSRSLHTSKKALSGNKQRETGKASDANTTDDVPDEELRRPNPHFMP